MVFSKVHDVTEKAKQDGVEMLILLTDYASLLILLMLSPFRYVLTAM